MNSGYGTDLQAYQIRVTSAARHFAEVVLNVINRPAGRATIAERVGSLFDERFATAPAWVALLELFLGMGWLRACLEKVLNSQWWNGAELEGFVAEHQAVTLDWYEPFLTYVVLPNSTIFAVIVFAGEVIAGAAFILARPRWLAPLVSGFLAMNFLAAGSPNPSVFYLMLTFALGLWWLEERASEQRAAQVFRLVTFGAIPLFGFSAIGIRTLEPSLMVEDPALVMCSFVACAFVAATIGKRALRASSERNTLEHQGPPIEYDIIDLGESPLSLSDSVSSTSRVSEKRKSSARLSKRP